MKSERRQYEKRRKKALVILAFVWALFCIYLIVTREHKPKLPPVDTKAVNALHLHLQCESINAFSRPPVISDSVAHSDALTERRKIGK
jgi:hypothetical protein